MFFMLVGSSYDLIVVPLFFLSILIWVAGTLVGNFLAARSALRSRRGSHARVFRGLAEPWGTRITKVKMFYVWFLAFLIPSVGFFPIHIWLQQQQSFIQVALYVPSLSFLMFCSFALCCLVGFQRSILSAENFFSAFLKPGTTTETQVSYTNITIKKKEISSSEE